MRLADSATDEVLFGRFRRGDAGAFEQLYRRYRETLYRFLLRGSVRDEAEDIYHDVWTRVMHSDGFDGGSFRAWLFHIARNLQIDRARRASLRPVAEEGALDACIAPGPAPEIHAHHADCGERLLAELDRLPPEQREAFLLKEESGLTLEQIGDLVKVGRETIKSRLRYALKRLRTALEDCL